MYVSVVSAQAYLLRLPIDAQGTAGEVTRISAPRVLKNADAIRPLSGDRLLIFESNAFGHDGPYGGAVVLARVTGAPNRDAHAHRGWAERPVVGPFVRQSRVLRGVEIQLALGSPARRLRERSQRAVQCRIVATAEIRSLPCVNTRERLVGSE